MEKAKQSFVNAGYKQAEIEAAIQKMPQATSQAGKQVVAPTETPVAKVSAESQGALPNATPIEKKGLSKTFKIILGIISAVILIAAGVIGFFWNKF